MNLFDHQDILDLYPNHTLIKSGGQKVVYRVAHSAYGDVALKIGQYLHPTSLERIEREVSLLQEIDSDYYPKNYDFQILENDRFLIIEEYIESKPLTDCFSRYETAKDVIFLVEELVVGLKVIWDKRVVHRDIKPDNILITSKDEIKIIDLGIARLLDMDSLTRTVAMIGPCTRLYAAPEQLTNRKTDISFRTDQFNIGIIMLQLLLKGNHPFDPSIAGGNHIVDNILNGNWYKNSLDLPEVKPLAHIISKLLGKEPYQRYRQDSFLMNEIKKAKEVIQ